MKKFDGFDILCYLFVGAVALGFLMLFLIPIGLLVLILYLAFQQIGFWAFAIPLACIGLILFCGWLATAIFGSKQGCQK